MFVKEGYEAHTPLKLWDTVISPAQYGVKHLGSFHVMMRDGVHLATDVWLPANINGAVPVIFIRTPYGRVRYAGAYTHFIQRGYAVVIQDTRGREDSEGEWIPMHTEIEDGDDSLNWIAENEWCDGNIGMIGASYGGYVQWAAAATFPGDPISDFSEHYYRTLKLEPIITDTFEKLGVKSLGSFDWGPPEILMSKVPIRSTEDFKGINIRATGIASMYYGALGASAVAFSAPEIHTGLQLGTVDAAEYNDYLVNKEMVFHEVTKYIIDPALHTGASIDKELIVNPESWAELPEDSQNIVISARDQARFNSAIAYGTESEKSKQEWIDHRVEIIRLPEEDIEKMTK